MAVCTQCLEWTSPEPDLIASMWLDVVAVHGVLSAVYPTAALAGEAVPDEDGPAQHLPLPPLPKAKPDLFLLLLLVMARLAEGL